MFKEPIIICSSADLNDKNHVNTAAGKSFIIHEWKGSGPDFLHVHFEDDEAWYVIEGILTFRFRDRTVEASKGTTVFVPAGVPHTYSANSSARYLIILTPRLNDLISELQNSPYNTHASVMKKYRSAIIN